MYTILFVVMGCIITTIVVLFLIKTSAISKILIRMGFKEHYNNTSHWALFSWNSCLKNLNIHADIAFFGDSLTRGGDFQNYFKDLKTVNLGFSGDTLRGMSDRIDMLKSVMPKKIFFMHRLALLRHRRLAKRLRY